MVTAEKTETNFDFARYEKELTQDQDRLSLRNQLVETSKNGEYITLPENTVNLKLDSSMILEKDFPHKVFGYIAGIMQEYPDVFGDKPIGREDGPFQLRLQKEDTTIGDLRETIDNRETASEAGETDPAGFKLNLLYGGETDSETPELSAVLVFGEPTAEQLESIRDKLPEGVPLLDGQTNELLDSVGADQREKAERIRRLETLIAALALMTYAKTTRRDYSFDANTPNYATNTSSSHFNESYNRDYDYDYHTPEEPEATPHQKPKTETFVPESKEVRLYGEATTLLNNEANKLGASSWTKLDIKDLERAQRRITRDLPDRDGKNFELLQKVNSLVADMKGPQEYIEPGAPEEKPTPAATTESTPQQQDAEVNQAGTEAETTDTSSVDAIPESRQPLAIEAAPTPKAITAAPSEPNTL